MFKELLKNNEVRCEKFLQLLKKDVFEAEHPLAAVYSQTKDFVKYEDRLKLKYISIMEGDEWGSAWESAWFHVTGNVPSDWKDKEVVLKLDFGSELMIFDHTGTPIYALTAACVFDANYVKTTYPIYNRCKGGDKVNFWIEGACNALIGINYFPDPKREQKDRHGVFTGKIKELKIGIFDRKVWELYMDVDVLLSLSKALPETIRAGRK